MFELAQIRCFVAVAEELNFGRAASRLNMTQPPLSRQIQVLERIINATLFDRTSRSVSLTLAGQSFLPDAKRILKLAESAALVARRIAGGKTGAVKIGFTAASAYSFLPQLFKAMLQRAPDADFSFKEMVSVDQFEELGSGQIDIGLLRPPISRPELASLRVAAESLVAAIPSGHELAGKKALSLSDFDGQPLVMYAPYESRYFYDLLLAEFVRGQVQPNYVQHLSQIHSILSLVRAGLGLAIVPETASSLRMEGVIFQPLQLKTARPAELFLAWRKDSSNPLLPVIVDIARGMSSAA